MERITGDSPEAKSLDITQQNIAQLKQLFPDVFSENKIDFEALKAVLGEDIDESEERYNFTWNGKTKSRQIAQTPSTGTLRPCKEESVNWDTTENLFIEGDNLEVLKLLQKSYHKQVKMIYIDPPYNTGKDFVYKDNFHENMKNYLRVSGQVDGAGKKLTTNTETSGRYHSDWLSMLYPRLKLARNLLSSDGIIFISIDDSEVSSLSSICNEIFGEENFVAKIIWKKRSGPPNDKIIAATHEYILAYAKNSSLVSLNRKPRSEEQLSRYKNPDNHPKGRWASDNLMANVKGGRYVESLYFPIINPNTGEEHYPSSNGNWRYNRDKVSKLLENEEIFWGVDGGGRPKLKRFLSEVSDGVPFSTLWDYLPFNSAASKEISSLLGNHNYFETPKPTALISHLMDLAVKEGDTVLDFFAGSGTAMHAAAIQCTRGKKIRSILVQLPEPTYENSEVFKAGYSNLADVSKSRLRACTEGHGLDGFKVFKLDETNIRPWDADFENLTQVLEQSAESIKADRTSEDVLYEIFLKYGYDLTTPVDTETVVGKQVFVVGAGALIVCLDDEISTDVVEGIARLKDSLDPETTQVVFKDAGFADSNVKTNAIQILKQAGIDDVKSI